MASNTPQSITLGTRRSHLARVQTDLVASALTGLHASLSISVHAMDPLGDRDKTTALYKLAEGAAAKSVWTGELEERLAAHALHAIVHSLKDMPTALPAGLVLGAVLPREDARDALVLSRPGQRTGRQRSACAILQGLPDGAVVGTSSLRRIAQLRRRFPRLRYEVCRGNVETRLRKLDAPGEFDGGVKFAALVLAAAGLKRINLGDRIDAYLEGSDEGAGVLWAVGQGAIGVECREDDLATREMLEKINHRETWLAILAERALLRTLEGGCSVPIGVETRWEGAKLLFKAAVVSVDGSTAVETDSSENVETEQQAEALGRRIALELLASGASTILDEIKKERKVQAEQELEAVVAAEAVSQVIV